MQAGGQGMIIMTLPRLALYAGHMAYVATPSQGRGWNPNAKSRLGQVVVSVGALLPSKPCSHMSQAALSMLTAPELTWGSLAYTICTAPQRLSTSTGGAHISSGNHEDYLDVKQQPAATSINKHVLNCNLLPVGLLGTSCLAVCE